MYIYAYSSIITLSWVFLYIIKRNMYAIYNIYIWNNISTWHKWNYHLEKSKSRNSVYILFKLLTLTLTKAK